MPRTLFLIDAYAQIFRAYYAIRGGMHSPVTSEPTHAVFGFTAMLLKLLQQHKPDYVLVAIDAPGKTFRDEMYDAYKATRNATPDDLTSQIPRIFELIELMGIPMLSYPGIEADDVIACCAARVLTDTDNEDIDVRIVSKDKDLEQLLGERVTLYDIHTDVTIDVPALMANKGVRPDQVIDLLTLTGDSVDNVKGVEGIGPKTATQLLQEFDTLDGIYANIDKIKGKRRENLEAARGHIELSKALVTLKCDVDLDFTLETARLRPIQLPRLLHLFQQLGFNRFQDEVRRLVEQEGPADASVLNVMPGSEVLTAAAESDAPVGTAEQGEYRAITTREELQRLVETLSKQPIVSFDTETSGLEDNATLCGLSLSYRPGEAFYVPVRSPEPGRHLNEQEVLSILGPLLEDPSVAKCGHNVKFDAGVLLRHGVRVRGAAFDSMLASALIDPGHGAAKLDTLALAALNHRMIPITDLIGQGREQASMETVPIDVMTTYAAEDADIALRLYDAFKPVLEREGMERLMREVEAPLTTVLAEMEFNGILCDPDELLRQGEILGGRVEELKSAVFETAGGEFDLQSTRQLADVLFDKLGLKAGKKTKTGRSTDVEVLEKLAAVQDRNDPKTMVPGLVLEYRQFQKLISTYLGNLRQSIDPKTGRIHSTFHQLVAATGRLASHGPNLQNIPVRTDVGRQIRKAFYAPDGSCLICADYSQIELRILAHLSGDPALIEAFEKDLDIHTAVASQVFNVPLADVNSDQRAKAKTINFGIIYGITPFGLARRIEGLDVPAATKLIGDYRRRYAGIDTFLHECVAEALKQGFVTTIMGRRRAIPEVHATHAQMRALGERLAINSVVQGSAADLIKMAMVNVQRRTDREKLPLKMLLQIHDELVFESPEDGARERAELVSREMETAMDLRVPLKVECGTGHDWLTAK